VIGTTLSHYLILESIGVGGMGVVYLAEDKRLHRKVALKFLPALVAQDPHARARFEREAQAASALDHPNISTIYEIGEWERQLFIAMAFYDGQTLRQRIEQGPMSFSEIASLVGQLASGLSAAHANGIVHRDLKPANIMVRRDGQLKILDFGLAKLAFDETMTRMTGVGTTVGTVAYMSPEQARGEEVDEAADVWALGVILYEMLAGRLPFPGSHPASVMAAVLNAEPAPLRNVRPDIPHEFEEIVEQALIKTRVNRTLTAVQVAQHADAYRARVASSGAIPLPLPASSRWVAQKRIIIPIVVVLLVAAVAGVRALKRNADIRWAADVALPQASQLAEHEQYIDAFGLARQVEAYLPNNQTLAKLWPVVSRIVSIDTDPSGADVWYRPYDAKDGEWTSLGRTPLHEIRIPRAMFRWRLERKGFATVEDAAGAGFGGPISLRYRLDLPDAVPSGMVRASSGNSPFSIFIPGLDHLPEVKLEDFWIDRYEVTNQAFKKFVDDGGYQNRTFWTEPFESDGRTLRWEEAIARFHDGTGRPGPSTWELGGYLSGQGDYPVTGISWYEAAAYARYAGKRLPTIYHWSRVAFQQGSATFVPLSNFGGRGPLAVGTSQAMNRYGAYDMAGNVKEWCWNVAGAGKRYILGGAWNEPVYMFTDADARSPFDRDATFGFRTVKLGQDSLNIAISGPIEFPSRDYAKERPVGDEAFNAYRALYSYDKSDLHIRTESVDRSDEDWTREKVSFDAAYGNERVTTYLYLPKSGTPPYQTVVLFPGSNVLRDRSFEASVNPRGFDYIIKSGRALAFPVYKSTFERGDSVDSDYPNTTSFWRDHVVMWSKDLGRTLDYLPTRPDIARDKFAYAGLSWGAQMGAILPAMEPRLKALVLIVGGFNLQKALPEVEPINFAPRITAPTLMLNGKYDFFYPTETSQLPMFRMLGAAPEHKRRVEYETGHSIPRNELIKEVLDWLDRYLGVVVRKP
jgi:dienelactone hydrolase